MACTRLYQMARSAGLISNDVEFDDQLEFTYYLLWHHDFEVAQRFYVEFVPQLKDVLLKAMQSGDTAKMEAARKVQGELDTVPNSENHRWFLSKMSPAEREARKKAAEEFRRRYAQSQQALPNRVRCGHAPWLCREKTSRIMSSVILGSDKKGAMTMPSTRTIAAMWGSSV